MLDTMQEVKTKWLKRQCKGETILRYESYAGQNDGFDKRAGVAAKH
jgi:hypothetical protein